MENEKAIREEIAEQREHYDGRSKNGPAYAKELEQKFIDLYLKNVCSPESTAEDFNSMLKRIRLEAGYTANQTAPLAHAKELLKRLYPVIADEISNRLKGSAALATDTLIFLCKHSKQDAVRLKAATELLNKAGFAETQKIEIKEAKDLSDSELQLEIKRAMEENGLKVVGG